MAITETVIKNQCTLKLNNGTAADGSVQTLNQSLGTMADSESSWDATKVMALTEAIATVLTKSVYTVYHTVTKEVTD